MRGGVSTSRTTSRTRRSRTTRRRARSRRTQAPGATPWGISACPATLVWPALVRPDVGNSHDVASSRSRELPGQSLPSHRLVCRFHPTAGRKRNRHVHAPSEGSSRRARRRHRVPQASRSQQSWQPQLAAASPVGSRPRRSSLPILASRAPRRCPFDRRERRRFQPPDRRP